MNALKHGLTAKAIIIGDEDPEEFELLRRGLHSEFKPSTVMEREMVERLAALLWRLRRVAQFESALIRERQIKIAEEEERVLTFRATPEQLDYALGALDALEKVYNEPDGVKNLLPATPGTSGFSLHKPEEVRPVETRVDHPTKPPPTAEEEIARKACVAFITEMTEHDALGKLSRYEAGLMNAFLKTLGTLRMLQTSRAEDTEASKDFDAEARRR